MKACTNVASCVGFTRRKDLTKDVVGECRLKKTVTNKVPNDPTYHMFEKSISKLFK
jgi:hypothetical protein